MKFFKSLTIFLLLLTIFQVQAQINNIIDRDIMDDDLQIGGNIFSDFSENIEESQISEHERYYRHGRFFAFNISLGLTSFDGNRGQAYENQTPSYSISFTFFQDFQLAYVLGFAVSKHNFFLSDATKNYHAENNDGGAGMVDVRILRTFFGARHYIDTSNLGTAITYSNPYLTGRLEYWYVTNKFIDQSAEADDTGGGFGFGMGFGLEFPLKIKQNYIGVEFLYHTVNFHDKFTQAYRPENPNGFGYEDLDGNAYTTMVSYVINW
ncbi:MAG: hypothetical protein KAQ98_04255 [Bacteriovoracaceae bacterium]|nr:hypothetical protein [Bacteriovoracaceae bacterium]